MELLAALRADVDAAFPALVDAYQDALYRFGLRLTANSQDAEDIAQEALIRAYRWLKSRGIAGEAQLRPWLYQVALNVFRNGLRRRPPPSAGLEAAFYIADGLAGPDEAAERGEARARLARALAGLPPRYREAVVLRHIEELTYPEMAAVLRRPEGTIKSDVHRGLALLRAALAPLREEVLV